MALSSPKVELKGYSCIICRNRKIKCNQCDPCSNCIKAEIRCSYVPPSRGKRKRTKPPKEGMHAKLKRYEELLKSYGETVEPSKSTDESISETSSIAEVETELDYEPWKKYTSQETKAKLITRGGSSAYFERPGEPIHETHADDSELFFESEVQSNTESLTNLHPPLQVTTTLKEIYIDRVDPMIKILHMPTFWIMLMESLQNTGNLSKSNEAVIFAFYLSAISTLDETHSRRLFRVDQAVVFARYRRAARQALINASFLSTSSLTTLQAYVLFLMCMRNCYRVDTLYILTGTMVRLGRKMGLHRDGTALGLSPFETESRRRLWWHIAQVDFRIADLMGMNPCLGLTNGDVKIPLNLEDEDLLPDMVEFPAERKCITAISLCLIRCEVIWALRKFSAAHSGGTVSWEAVFTLDMPLSRKQSIISEVEDYLESKYLRYCDPCIPLHTFMSVVIRSSICKMKLSAHNPRQFASTPHTFSQSERDMIFDSARKLLEYVNLVRSGTSGLSKYAWLLGTSYLWNTMLYVLIEAKHHETGPEVDKLWGLIGEVFSHSPQLFEKSAGPVYTAIGKWTLKVWDDYVTASKAKNLLDPVVPDYINAIRQCRAPGFESKFQDTSTAIGATMFVDTDSSHDRQDRVTQGDIANVEPLEGYNFPDLMSFEIDPDKWIQWEQLMAEQDGLDQVNIIKHVNGI